MLTKLLSLLFLGIGVFVIVQVAAPFFAFKMWEVTAYDESSMLADPTGYKNNVAGVSIAQIGDFPAIISSRSREGGAPYSEFRLSIPRLNLNKLLVKVDSNDFENNLAQLPGSSMPGERGNLFVTGHSSLAQLFRPDNYKAIFAHLPEIKKDDVIIVDAIGERFEYIVQGMKIVDPHDVGVVSPPDTSGRYLTLMTCVPPGFSTKRLIVLAKLK